MSVITGRVLGRYRIGERIGKGGMGEVYRARDVELERDVAVKVLPDSFAANPDRLRRFQREARAVARLSHPNILEIHDVGEDGGTRFAVTELLHGNSLREVLNGGPLPWRQSVEIATAVARGLAAAHEQGVIHRDIKPGNVFVVSDGRVKVLDFGLARFDHAPAIQPDTEVATATATAVGVVMGTPGYMSPEQLRATHVDQRTDIFSLGCVLYEMATGRRPFSGETAADTLSAVLSREPGQLCGTGVVVPLELERIVKKCLAKQPCDRFASAEELIADLESIPPDAKPSIPLQASTTRLRAGPGWFGRGAVVLVIAALIALLAWWTGRGPPDRATLESAQPAAIRSVSIGTFENLTGDAGLDFWEESLPEIVTTVLSQLEELSIADAGDEARGLVSGALVRSGDEFGLELRLRDGATGRYVVSRSVEAADSDGLRDAATHAATGVREHLELGLLRERFPLHAWAADGTSSAEAFLKLTEGLDLRMRGDFESSVASLEAAVEADPDYNAARIYLFISLSTVGRWEESDRIKEQVDAQLNALSPRERYMVEAINAWEDKEAFRSIEYFRKLVDLDPNDRENWYWLAMRYVRTEQYEKAIEPLERFFELQARWGPEMKAVYPYYFLADAYLETGQPDKALETAERGLALFQHRALWQVAQTACRRKGDVGQAEAYQKLWTDDMLSEVCGQECIALNLGDMYWGRDEDLQRAEAEYRRSLEIDPGYVPVMFRLARLLILDDVDVQEGMTLLGRAIEEDYRVDEAQVIQGRGFHKLGDPAKAVEILEQTWEKRRSYDHWNKVFLEDARNALAALRETTTASAGTVDG